jgi:hypothetical protein
LTHLRPRMQCNVDLCAATYKSFHAPDCTYQPNGGGPRSICELSTRPADARSQTSRAATDARFEAKDTRVAETAEGPEIGNACSGRTTMQRRSLRGHVQVFQCRGLHL